VWQIRGRRNAYMGLRGKSERKEHLEELGTDGKMLLKWVMK
jgi:hypothetical protein